MAPSSARRTVVVHPPFRWQRDYAAGFVDGVARLARASTASRFAVENMYPWRARGRELQAYLPGWDPRRTPTATSPSTSRTPRRPASTRSPWPDLGDRLAHVHLADGIGSAKDEHLVPGPRRPALRRRARPLAEQRLDRHGRRRGQHPPGARPASQREADLAESLAFARLHLATRAPSR